MKNIHKYLIKHYGKVRDFAAEVHAKENLLYDVYPYVYHLDMVAANVIIFNEDPKSVAAAYCHDIIEDTEMNYFELGRHLKALGYKGVEEIVYNVSNETGRNRNERLIKTIPKIISSKESMFVKLCDRKANIDYSSTGGSSTMFAKYQKEHLLFKAAVELYGYNNIKYIKLIMKKIEEIIA